MRDDERRLTLAADATVRTYVGDDGWTWVVAHRGSDVAALQAAWPDEALTPGGLSVDSALRAERDGSFGLGARGGRCLLLEEDGRCGAHVRLGAAGKPAGCRAFPLRDAYAD